MEVVHLNNAVTPGKTGVIQGQVDQSKKTLTSKAKKTHNTLTQDRVKLKAALDKAIRNTRIKYDIKDEMGYFVVRIIDKDTDKVIKEIPSKEIQSVHDHIGRILGILFDKEI